METRRGTAIVWVAILFVVLVFFVGISLDWGKAGLNVHELHNGADAAALAGAQYVKFDVDGDYGARSMAILFAQKNNAERKEITVDRNVANAPDGELVIGRWLRQTREFIPTLEAPNAVKVVGRRQGQRPDAPPLTNNWGGIFGTQNVKVERYAIAQSISSVGAGLLTLLEDPNKDGIGLRVGGGDEIYVMGGDIQDNSQFPRNPNDKEGFRGDRKATIECEELNVCGDIYPTEDDDYWDQYDYSVNANTKVPLPDPLLHAVLPDGKTEVQVKGLWDTGLQGPIPDMIKPPPPDRAYPAPVGMEVHDYGVYGMAIDVDAAGNPVLVDGKYVNKGYDASSAEPIDGTVIATYGEPVGGMQTITLVPGYYPGGVRLTSPGNKVKLLPGIYEFGGGNKVGDNSGLVVMGGEFEALGVMLYITKSNHPTGGFWGSVKLTGGMITISESYDPATPDDEPYPNYPQSFYKYIAVFQDRANREPAEIHGNSEWLLTGTFYFPTAHMTFSGGSLDGGTQLIAGSIETYGNTILTINYDGRFFYKGYRSILVE